jgi:hypothetical protein
METLSKNYYRILSGWFFIFVNFAASTESLSNNLDTNYEQETTPNYFEFLKLRNSNGNALLSIIPKTGSPLSPTSNYGGSLFYNPNDFVSYCFNTGTYKRSTQIHRQGAELNSAGLCGLVLLGDRGSTLSLGLNINYYLLLTNGNKFNYFSVLPALGIRIESDAEIILHFEISKNINARSSLQRDLGDAPTDFTVLNSKRMEASLGLGIGI